MLRHVERESEVAGLLGLPGQRVGRAALRRDANFLRHLVAVGGAERDRRRSAAGQRAFDREWNAHRLAGDAEGRGVEAQQLDIRQPLRAADRHGEHGNAGHAEREGRFDRRLALVPVAVGGQHDSPQRSDFFECRGQRSAQIGAAAGRRLGNRLHRDVEPFARAAARFRFA